MKATSGFNHLWLSFVDIIFKLAMEFVLLLIQALIL